MGSLFLRHVEKIVFLVVLVLCGYWARNSLDQYSSSRNQTQAIKSHVEAVRDILDTRSAEKLTPQPWLDAVRKLHSGPFDVALPVPNRIPWYRPPADYGPRPFGVGSLPPPSDPSARAGRSAVSVSWSLSGVLYCEPKEFEIFRRTGDQKEYPKTRYDHKRVSPPWPVPDFSAAAPAAGPRAVGPPLATEETESARPTTEDECKALNRTFTYTDNKVEPNKIYWYRVRVRARMLSDVELPKSILGVKRPEDPPLAKYEEIAGEEFWTSKDSAQLSARTPSDIRLKYVGTEGTQPHWSARIEVKKWSKKEEKWVTYMAKAARREKIIGERRIMTSDYKIVVEKLDSGYTLLDIEKGITYPPDKPDKPILLNRVKVRNTATGEEKWLDFGVEEEDLIEEKALSEPERTEETTPSERRSGRRRRGRASGED